MSGCDAFFRLTWVALIVMAIPDEQAEQLLAKARQIDARVWTTFRPPPQILFEKL